MKIKNLTHLALSAEQFAAILSAVSIIDSNTTGLVALPPAQKQKDRGIGPRSEVFCRQALALMERHTQLLPPRIPLAQTLEEIKTYDTLRTVNQRLTELLAKSTDSQFALGSNIYAVALEGYNQLRRLGNADGLKEACAELAQLFSRSPAAKARAKARRSLPAGPAPDTGSAA